MTPSDSTTKKHARVVFICEKKHTGNKSLTTMCVKLRQWLDLFEKNHQSTIKDTSCIIILDTVCIYGIYFFILLKLIVIWGYLTALTTGQGAKMFLVFLAVLGFCLLTGTFLLYLLFRSNPSTLKINENTYANNSILIVAGSGNF